MTNAPQILLMIMIMAYGVTFKPRPQPRPRLYNGEETTCPVLIFWMTSHEYGDLDHDNKVNLRDWYIWHYKWDDTDRIRHRQKIVQSEKKAKARKRIMTYLDQTK